MKRYKISLDINSQDVKWKYSAFIESDKMHVIHRNDLNVILEDIKYYIQDKEK